MPIFCVCFFVVMRIEANKLDYYYYYDDEDVNGHDSREPRNVYEQRCFYLKSATH